MKKQSKNLKLNKSVVSELSIEKAGEIKGGLSAPRTWCLNRTIGCTILSIDVVCSNNC